MTLELQLSEQLGETAIVLDGLVFLCGLKDPFLAHRALVGLDLLSANSTGLCGTIPSQES